MKDHPGIRVLLSASGLTAQVNGPKNGSAGLMTQIDLDQLQVYVLRDGFAEAEWFDSNLWIVPDSADMQDVSVVMRAA